MTAWKIDPALRARLAAGGPVAIAVQPLATATDDDLLALGDFPLAPLTTPGGLWTGDVPADQVAAIAALPSVGYVHDGAAPSDAGAGTIPRAYTPPTPAKRGHTKLPPRRQ